MDISVFPAVPEAVLGPLPADQRADARERLRVVTAAFSSWKIGEYQVSRAAGAVEPRLGYQYRGLGLHQYGRESPAWALVHLGSGHAVLNMEGDEATIFELATKIAECGDWEFSGLEGYKNQDPTLVQRTRGIAAAFVGRLAMKASPGDKRPEAADAIKEARAYA